jgi:phospholipid/cholesterol/gamma-HCH transport system substrate-binding protein
MDERMMQFRVGVMVLATLLITAILVVMFGKAPTMLGRYTTIRVAFQYAPGVTEGTPVRKSGILIGRVTGVKLVEDVKLLEKNIGVIVTAEIQQDTPLYANEHCEIVRELVGDVYLAFVPDPAKLKTTESLSVTELLPGTVSMDPTGLKRILESPINTVEGTGRALTDASNELKLAAEQVRVILKTNEEDVRTVVKNAITTLEAVGKSANSANALIGDEETQAQLKKAMRSLPDTLDSLNRTIHLAERSLTDLQKFTAPLGKDPEQRANELLNTLDQLAHITAQLGGFSDRLASSKGTLGQLIDNPELYEHLNRAAKNIDEVSRQLKPIVSDARAFTDKVSRHPGSIARDALWPGPGIK